MDEKNKRITPRQFAEMLRIPYQTVMRWIQKRQIPGAQMHKTPTGHHWSLPASAVESVKRPPRGRPKENSGQGKP